MRTRPNHAWWHAPHPPLCDPKASKCTAVLHKLHCSKAPGYPDQHFVLPRATAHVMRDIIEQYRRCHGRLYYHSVEDWLIINLQYATEELGLPPTQRTSFPFVIVRNGSAEPTARYFCCGSPHEYRRCMRGAYPAENLPTAALPIPPWLQKQ